MPQLDIFCRKDGKDLRFGYTTGSCAAAASKAAARMLLEGSREESVELMTPKGILLNLPVEEITAGEGFVSCAIRKDSGDDPDITNGILIFSRVEFSKTPGITLEGGFGVGRVTKPGLECPVGAPAINRVPREMITAAVRAMQEESGNFAGLKVTISIPEGERLAKRTFNPRLGIVGGLSVLGTSGIVEPMSEAALVDTIRVEMKQLAASGRKMAVITPGNYGEDFMKEALHADLSGAVKCSNFVGETLDMAGEFGFQKVLLIGHIGKFVKLAAGIMNTHSRYADGRMEVMGVHAALCGAGRELVAKLMDCVTTDDALDVLEEAGLLKDTLSSILQKIDFHLKARSHGDYQVEAVIFSNKRGLLGMTAGAEGMLREFLAEGME
ncbi:MAG TPA: cobalamin biosynthesis protein CbiD [Candidatus Merdivicinus excrementipullorum]|uniref:Cobalt-precorrin-5B C(1)-methyltransferase n=1 Tax=Candidatus Merdivicinus excrementipullorum TaxID=2840867 RepID=A0A9D1FML7_9FIRM|nr:cobalamin biosynthesis protein CbiD [Candidatus Merdivicinus excrementipullorum]